MFRCAYPWLGLALLMLVADVTYSGVTYSVVVQNKSSYSQAHEVQQPGQPWGALVNGWTKIVVLVSRPNQKVEEPLAQ